MTVTTTRSADHIVIGGGIIGLLTTYYLTRAGARVMLIERGETGKESSWAGGGILSPLYPWRYPDAVTRLASWSQSRYPELIDHLQHDTGIDAELINSGMLILDCNEQEQAITWADRTGATLHRISSRDAQSLQPGIRDWPEDAIWLPDVNQVRNPRLVKALKQYLLQQGVQIKEHTDVTSILNHNQRAQGIVTPHETIRCQNVIIACGAWSAELTKQFGTLLEIEPVRGQMILLRAKPDTVRRIVLGGDRYVIPRSDGNVLVGSTLEHVGFDKSTTSSTKSALLNSALELVPKLADFPVTHHWSGLRPGSKDGTPVIGAHPYIEGLFINSGHFRNGVVMAPASSSLMADIVLDRKTGLSPNPYLPRGQ